MFNTRITLIFVGFVAYGVDFMGCHIGFPIKVVYLICVWKTNSFQLLKFLPCPAASERPGHFTKEP